MEDAARRLEAGGAEVLIICSNTMHRMAGEVAAAVAIPLIHIADPTGAAIAAEGFTRVGLLGTAFTMEGDFYKGRLARKFGLEVLTPGAADRARVDEIIYRELVAGLVLPASRQAYREVIGRLAERGAQAVILGCTEIMLLISQADSPVPLFDTTTLHALAAVDHALGGGGFSQAVDGAAGLGLAKFLAVPRTLSSPTLRDAHIAEAAAAQPAARARRHPDLDRPHHPGSARGRRPQAPVRRAPGAVADVALGEGATPLLVAAGFQPALSLKC